MLPSECLKHDWLIDVRKYVANDKALNSAAQLGPILDHVQLRRYVLRRRFRVNFSFFLQGLFPTTIRGIREVK